MLLILHFLHRLTSAKSLASRQCAQRIAFQKFSKIKLCRFARRTEITPDEESRQQRYRPWPRNGGISRQAANNREVNFSEAAAGWRTTGSPAITAGDSRARSLPARQARSNHNGLPSRLMVVRERHSPRLKRSAEPVRPRQKRISQPINVPLPLISTSRRASARAPSKTMVSCGNHSDRPRRPR